VTTTLLSRLSGKRFGVVLSAGYFGFYAHTGFVEALLDTGLIPSAWAGSSAGGMVAALSAAGMPIAELKALILSQRREHFWDPDWLGIAVDSVRRGHRPSGLLKGARFRALLEKHLPVKDFEATRWPLVLVATSLSGQRAMTLTTGDLASAVHATCAYPGLFQTVRRNGVVLWDGGIVDKAPALALVDAKVAPIEALLIHYLPSASASRPPKGPLAFAQGMSQGLAAVRREHFRLQLELLAARGIPTYTVTSRVPQVSPRLMHTGSIAMEAGAQSLRHALSQGPLPWTGED
jgi:NTE family protein